MKNLFILFICITLTALLIACLPAAELSDLAPDDDAAATPAITFDGKIAIISGAQDNEEDGSFNSASLIAATYGADKVIHLIWPAEQELMINTVSELSADPQVKAVIISSAVPGTVAALDYLRESRPDLLIICSTMPQDSASDMARLADLILSSDDLAMGVSLVRQAQKMGARTVVHYSLPENISQPLIHNRRNLIKQECQNLGLEFVEAITIDPLTVPSDSREDVLNQFFLEAVKEIVQKYGQNTAVFCVDCASQIPLIKAIIENGALYVQPCHQSHGLDLLLQALNISGNSAATAAGDNRARISTALSAKNMQNRITAWPMAEDPLFDAAAAAYAIKWINGEVSSAVIDTAVLRALLQEYAGVEVYITPLADDGAYSYYFTDEPSGEILANFLLISMDYLTF